MSGALVTKFVEEDQEIFVDICMDDGCQLFHLLEGFPVLQGPLYCVQTVNHQPCDIKSFQRRSQILEKEDHTKYKLLDLIGHISLWQR